MATTERRTALAPTDLGTILAVWAHPDDETFLAGGIMADAVANGQRVVCVAATAGERGTDDPVEWPPERLGRVRRWEARAAMAVLGVADHRWLGLPDGHLADLDPDGPIESIAWLIDDVGPDTILTFGPDGMTFHPDHRTISTWVTEAWRRRGAPGRLLHAAMSTSQLDEWAERYEAWGVFMTDERPTGVPDAELAVDHRLSPTTLDQKMAALLAMHSQTAPALAVLGAGDFRHENAFERFVACPAP
ncbi:MAG: PIG-L family deacetylase [Acidimicrobiia bacterium]|nr:PIG-L family deacetylase [Acidimicrobiia bacterium]